MLDPSAKRGPKLFSRLKISGVHEPPSPYFRANGAPSDVTLIKQWLKRHCYVAANKLCIGFLKVHFLSFFRQVNGSKA